MNEDTGFAVLRLRRQKKWTQETLAERAGVSISTIRRVELATHVADTNTLTRIAAALNVPLVELVAGHNPNGEAVRPGAPTGTGERSESAEVVR